MKSRAVRVLLVILAIAAQAGAAVAVWQFEQQIGTERSSADTFERDARQAVLHLTELRAAQQAYVAEGQSTNTWLATATELSQSIAPQLTALRLAAGSVEAQGALETAVETFSTALSQTDTKARGYLKAGQTLSASDVIFTDGASTLTKVVNAIDGARGEESIAHAAAIAGLRQWQLSAIGASVVLTLLALLLLVPIPLGSAARGDEEFGAAPADSAGLGLLRATQGARGTKAATSKATPAVASPEDDPLAFIDFDSGLRPSRTPDLKMVADICSSLALVGDARELQGLLERTAKALDASGLIIWMPDGPGGPLRQVLAHGYAPLALACMGRIDPASDNATATAFRTRTVLVVPSEPLASGAIVAPLITADGCSGAMAVELRRGVETTDHLRAVATIFSAQLATLFTPTAPATPTASATPTAPARPTASATPTAPATPTASATPAAPATPTASATPAAPATPTASATPAAAATALADTPAQKP